MDVLTRVIEQGLMAGLLDDSELEQLRDEVDMIDLDTLREAVVGAISGEIQTRSERHGEITDWLRARPARRRR